MKNQASAEYSRSQVWRIMVAIILSSVIYGFGMFKFIPMQEAITTYFGIGEGAYGYLNSANNWVVIILSVQMGFLIRKWPSKATIIFGYAIALAGMLLQIFAPVFSVFVAGRVVEGGGLALAYLSTTSLLLNMVPRGKVGMWSGISIFCSVAPQILITKGGSVLLLQVGMTFIQIFAAIAVLYLITVIASLILIPGSVRVNGTAEDTKPTREQTWRVFKDPSNWLVNISYVFFSLVSISFSAYVIQFLTIKGMEANHAATVYSYTTLLGMIFMLAFGWISDKLHTKRKLVIIGYFAGAVALVLLARLPVSMIMIYVIVYGTLPRSIAGLTTAAATDIAEVPSDVSIVNSLRNEVTQVGTVVFTIVLGYIIEYMGYYAAIYLMTALMAVGGVFWIFAKKIP